MTIRDASRDNGVPDSPFSLRLIVVWIWLICGGIACRDEPQSASRDAEVASDSAAATDASPESELERHDAPEDTISSKRWNTASDAPVAVRVFPEFDFTDQEGNPVDRSEMRGKVWVASLDTTGADRLLDAVKVRLAEFEHQSRGWPDANRLHFVSFMTDSTGDARPHESDGAKPQAVDHRRWRQLRGDAPTLSQICQQGFGTTLADATDFSRITWATWVLVDPVSRIRGTYSGLEEKDLRRLVHDVRALLGETETGLESPVHVGSPFDVFYTPWLDARQATQQEEAERELPMFHGFQFTDRREESGITFVNRGVSDVRKNWMMNHYDHGNGLAAADVDGDGLTDLYFTSQVGGNQLWRNRGQGAFEDITAAAGVALADRVSVTASFADTDNDGDPDLYVTTTRHGNALFVNDGQGHFRDATVEAGLEYRGHSSSAEFFDYDRDGRLDLFLVNVGQFTTEVIGYSGDLTRHEDPYYVGDPNAFAAHLIPERAERKILYHNDGENRFRDVTEEMNLVDSGWSGDATPIDADEDGWIDLYVLNMQGTDELFRNVEGRRFERFSRALFDKIPFGAMGVKSFDYDNDGHLDLYVTNMHADMWRRKPSGVEEKQRPPAHSMPSAFLRNLSPGHLVLGNAFYANAGDGIFHDVAVQINAESYWPWGLSTGDLNADGWQDVFLTASMNLQYRYHPNGVLLNDHGQRFEDAEFVLGVEPRRDGRVATPWFELECSGADAGHPVCQGRTGKVVVWGAIGSRSSVITDLDDDGDLDIVTNDFNSPPMVLLSDLGQRRSDFRFLKIRLRGSKSNRDGLGARVQVTAGGMTQTQIQDGQSGYLSQSIFPLYFGLDTAISIERIDITWPSGNRQILEGPLEPNQELVIAEPG